LTFTNILVFLKKLQCMRFFFTLSLFIIAGAAAAQPKMVTQAIITTTTSITAPETEDAPAVPPPPSAEGGPVIIRRSMMDAGETKSITWVKNNMVKTVVENDMGRNTTIRDNNARKTTTLMEIMGNKRGFYATDEEQEAMKKKMDSMIQTRNEGQAPVPAPASFVLHYRNDSKEVAGYVCKKAVIVYTRPNGSTDSITAWYNTEVMMKGLNHTGGPGGGFMSFGRVPGMDGIDKIEGFIMQYETNMGRGRKMTVTVTKLDIQKEVKDKEFDISKDFDLKPMKDMQGPGGGVQIRIGGPGGQ
jgi:hypothetical protein